LGFRVVDAIAEACSTRIRRSKYRALTATVRIGRSEVLLMKPQTYMNLSGSSVRDACRDLELAASHLVVVCDDADLALGRLRVRMGGGTGGHRGLRSIIDELQTADFVRVRAGVGRPPDGTPLDQHVLSGFTQAEHAVAEALVERGAAAVRAVIDAGVETAMREYNGPVVEFEAQDRSNRKEESDE